MQETLRHSIILLAITSLMASCDSYEPDPADSKSEMQFEIAALSRASETTSQSITSKPFVVYSDMASMDPEPESKYIPIHNATQVSYNASAQQWSYNNPQYWFDGFQYAFVALHPAYVSSMSDILYKNNQLTFKYKQPSNYQTASDLLISTHRRNYSGGKADAVRLSFTHILTNVNIMVSYKGISSGPRSITIDGLTFQNIPIESIYSIKPAPLTGNSEMTSDWVNEEGSQNGWKVKKWGSLNINFPNYATRTAEVNKDAIPLFSKDDALMLLPNPYDPDSPTEVELRYTTDTGEKETISAIIPRGWNPGTNVILSLGIDNGLVQFSISVEDWTDGDTTNTTVPRK